MNILDGRDEKESVNNIKKNSTVVRTHFDKIIIGINYCRFDNARG